MSKTYRVMFFWVIILLTNEITYAQKSLDTLKRIDPVIEFKEDIIKLIREAKIDNAILGINIKSLEQNQVIFNLNDNKNMIPASLQKLFTTAISLRYLGENYKFQTRIYFDGNVNSRGVYKGNIIIRGYGDPTHSELFDKYRSQNFLDFFITILDSLGISKIEGNIIGDDNFFDDEYYPDGWQVDDLNYSYASQISALSVYRNSVKINIMLDNKDSIPKIMIEPKCDYIEINNHIEVSEDKTDIKVSREIGTNTFKIHGTIAKSIKSPVEFELAIDNPTLFFLNILKEYLKVNYIDFNGLILDIDDLDFLPDYDNYKDFKVYYSPELKYILKEINSLSLNLESEMLLKTIGREIIGYGSTENGLQIVKQFIYKTNFEENSLNLSDGSGLSRLNYYSCQTIQKLLEFIYKSNYFKIFLNSLARPGEEGTLKYRMQNSAAKKLVYAKTGTMTGVSNIAGYVYSRDGELFSFVIMIMNHNKSLSEIHDLQNLITMRISAFTRYPEYYRIKE